ncbi:hypothetical protein KC19_6G044500 [Ceratodon purpureus]|uniref:Uncharacterized protein n=1 Tax=Ceratodon purpureus TaxID=3225 RepID=A0A8T0HBG3_CERPU|nr:hypothetical protein KC19_6G044500 [Ceratodon purpureus]
MFPNIFSFFSGREPVPNVDALIKRCREVARGSDEFWSSALGSCHDFVNWHQCDFLAQRVKAADSTLAAIEESVRFLASAIPVLQELYIFLHNADMLMRRSHIISDITVSGWLRAALEQGDLKETFSHLIYDIEWCTSLLQSIVLESSKMTSFEFEPTSCNYQLCSGHELALLKAMKEDEMDLLVYLERTAKLNELIPEVARDLAEKLHAKHLACSRDLVFLKPEDLDLGGKLIGRGSFGVVRKSNFLNGKCVVKMLEQIQSTSIEKEIDAIRKLGNHPHIVRHFCFSKNDLEREVYLVMELLDMDLDRAIRRMKGRLSVVEAVSLLLQIGEGMRYMHDKGVAHRDLKPGNVLVNFDEGSSRISSVKIADFGSTKAAERTETNTMGTGTTRYMAPEVMKAREDPEKARLNLLKADVYSFAMMSVHILTGKYPFEPSNPGELKKRSKAGERPILRYELPNCPLRLATLLTKCWSQIPDERPPFPEICRELRYIKGLLLKGDEQKLQEQFVSRADPQKFLGGVKLQGPWGDSCGYGSRSEFYDMATSIRSIELGYIEGGRPIALFEVTYEILGKIFTRESYLQTVDDIRSDFPRYKTAKIELQPDIEYIKQISGSLFEGGILDGPRFMNVSSLTIHTNLGTYGPFGGESSTKFSSDTGSRVIGFHGEGETFLHRLGVVTIPDL